MITFPAFTTNFELYPEDCEAARHLAPLFDKLQRIDFTLRVDDPSVNQGQMASNFDAALEQAFLVHGAELNLRMPSEIPQELDFQFCATTSLLLSPKRRAEMHKQAANVEAS